MSESGPAWPPPQPGGHPSTGPTAGPPNYSPVPTYPGPGTYPPGHAVGSSGSPSTSPVGNRPGSVGLPASFLAQTPLREDYARWPRRVAVDLIDHAPTYLGLIVFYAGYFRLALSFTRATLPTSSSLAPMVVGVVIMLAGLGWTIYNRWFLAGRTGQSWGRKLLGVWLVGRETNQPIGR